MLSGFNLNWVCFTSVKDSKEFIKFVTSCELGFVSFVGFTVHVKRFMDVDYTRRCL